MNMNSVPVSAKRPRVLIRASQIACKEFVRERDLKRVLGSTKIPKPGAALDTLSQIESRMDTARREKAAGYNVRAHIMVLAALMTELRFCRPSALSLVT